MKPDKTNDPDKRKSVSCMYCGEQTYMVFTELCDSCYELQRLITAYPAIARQILIELGEINDNS